MMRNFCSLLLSLAAILCAAPSMAQPVTTTPIICGSAVSTCQLKAAPGQLIQLYATPSAAGYLMVFNTTTAPTNGTTTAGTLVGDMTDCIGVSAGATVSMQIITPMWNFSGTGSGIYAAYSSTGCGTLTLSATAFIKGAVQ